MHRAEGDARPPHVLRTHTSPVQIRTMEARGAPLRIICPGGVYRADYDQTHTPMFHQVEGLAIDKDISMANLKWVLEEFFAAFFEIDGIKTRFRASHFPIHRTVRRGRHPVFVGGWAIAYRRRRRTGWKFWAPAWCTPRCLLPVGLILKRGKAFAFGMGIDRIAMLKYGIPDLRAFFDSDLRWLRHYGFASLDQPTLHAGLSR